MMHNIEKDGVWLMEVFNVVYRGHKEVKPDQQIGTIKVNDGVHDHYLYDVSTIDEQKPSIEHLDEIVLSGPFIRSLSAKGSLTFDVNLFCGAFKDSFPVYNCPHEVQKCVPLEDTITSKDGRGEVCFLYAVFDNATEAHIKVKFIPKSPDFNPEVYGVVTASTNVIHSLEYSSMLFIKKDSDKIKVVGKKFPLSRSIVAVPLGSDFFVDMHLKMAGDESLLKGTATFKTQRNARVQEDLECKYGTFNVQVSWKCRRK